MKIQKQKTIVSFRKIHSLFTLLVLLCLLTTMLNLQKNPCSTNRTNFTTQNSTNSSPFLPFRYNSESHAPSCDESCNDCFHAIIPQLQIDASQIITLVKNTYLMRTHSIPIPPPFRPPSNFSV